MAKTAPVKPASATSASPSPSKVNFPFGRENYILMAASAIILVIGYMLMSGGKTTDPNVFNGDVFSFRRITLAPIVVMIGYGVGIWAIVKKAK